MEQERAPQTQPGAEEGAAADGGEQQPESVGDMLGRLGFDDGQADEDPIAPADEVQQRLQQMRGEQPSRQPGEAGDEEEPGDDQEPVDPLQPLRETLDAGDTQLPDDDEAFEQELAGLGDVRLVPRGHLDRVYEQRNRLRERYGVGTDGQGAYDEALALLKQAGPDSQVAIQNLVAQLYQHWSQQAQQAENGGYGMSQPTGGYPTQQQPAAQMPFPQAPPADQPPAWAQDLIGKVSSLTQQQEQQLRQQERQEVLSSVERELRRWDLLGDPLAQQYVGMTMRQDPSIPVPELVKRYAELKRKSFEQVANDPASGPVPPAGSLSPDIGRGTTGAMPPSGGGGVNLAQLKGEERVKAAEAILRGSRGR